MGHLVFDVVLQDADESCVVEATVGNPDRGQQMTRSMTKERTIRGADCTTPAYGNEAVVRSWQQGLLLCLHWHS